MREAKPPCTRFLGKWGVITTPHNYQDACHTTVMHGAHLPSRVLGKKDPMVTHDYLYKYHRIREYQVR